MVVSEMVELGCLGDLLIINPVALRKAKIVYNFGLSECIRVNVRYNKQQIVTIVRRGFQWHIKQQM